tara:strand:- start:2292 stop:2480 length:189 start_codon:yes stop_codon:yes gene_type:complete
LKDLEILVKEALQRLRFTAGQGQAGLTHTVLATLGLGCNGNHIATGTLGGVIAVDGVVETLG